MPEKWTGELVGKMHNQRVHAYELAEELGCSKSYISMILRGERTPVDAENKLYAAFYRVLERRKMNGLDGRSKDA